MTDDEPEERKYRAPALEKGLDVLELLTAHGRPMTPSQMSNVLGRSVNELFRMIQVLEFRGYIEPTADGYRLTNRLFTLGLTQPRIKSLIDVAGPAMQALAYTTYQSCHLVVLSGEEIVVVHRVETPGDLGYSIRIGYRRPVIEATSGLMLYGLAPPRAKQLLAARLVEAHGEERAESFFKAADDVAAQRYIVRPSDFVRGVTDLCAAVMGSEGIVATLNTPFIEHRPPSLPLEPTLHHIRRTADEMSVELSGRAAP